jgi:DNA (cytosine-5)-methyltransferase 1
VNWYEFFAGGGMARLGLGERWKCLFANEWSNKKAAAYTRRFGGVELRVCDVATLTPADIPGAADLAWASFPCQDLSLAGAGAGLGGARSGTLHAFWDLMDALAREGRAPGVVVLENVVGAITSHGGRDFAAILGRMAETGYSFGPLVLDAVHWLPQSRPRLFIVGLRGTAPAGAPGFGHTRALIEAYDKLDSCLRQRWVWWRLPEPSPRTVRLAELLEECPATWHSPAETDHLLQLMSDLHRRKVANAAPGEVGTVYRRTRQGRQRAEVRFDGISGCLRTPAGGSSRQTVLVISEGVRSRLLTAREAARLMGVPDDYPLPPKYNDAYHLFGDGLAVPVVRYLEEQLLRGLVADSPTQTTAAETAGRKR